MITIPQLASILPMVQLPRSSPAPLRVEHVASALATVQTIQFEGAPVPRATQQGSALPAQHPLMVLGSQLASKPLALPGFVGGNRAWLLSLTAMQPRSSKLPDPKTDMSVSAQSLQPIRTLENQARARSMQTLPLTLDHMVHRPGLSPMGYWKLAEETHGFIVANMLLGPRSLIQFSALDDVRASIYKGAYLTTSWDTTFAWWNVSHIAADAEMSDRNPAYVDYMNDTYDFMRRSVIWANKDPVGGYFAWTNLVGTRTDEPKYVDDNTLAGVAYLDAADALDALGDTKKAAEYRESARWIANFLMWRQGLWGGPGWTGNGFWWTSERWWESFKLASPDGNVWTIKPTNANGLAAQLFYRLWENTQEWYYIDWADSIMDWVESTLAVPDGVGGAKLYSSRLDVVHPVEDDSVKAWLKFTYDQAIMIEALLIRWRVRQKIGIEDKNGPSLQRARVVAQAMIDGLWSPDGGFVLRADNADPIGYSYLISPVYSGWATRALVKLYEVDGQVQWLDWAQYNVDAINTRLRDQQTGGYYAWASKSYRSDVFQSVDQAWMQQVMAMLARYRM